MRDEPYPYEEGKHVRTGGLYRCCMATLFETDTTELEKTEGAIVKCAYCKATWMQWHDGAWEWDGELHTEGERR
jgi:hypothetical protein